MAHCLTLLLFRGVRFSATAALTLLELPYGGRIFGQCIVGNLENILFL